MHLLRVDTVSLDEGEAAVDLGQTPGDVVFLSFTDSDLFGLARAYADERDRDGARVPSPVRERDRVRDQTFPERANPSPQPSPARERGHAAPAGLPSLRLAKLARLRHPMSVDLYVDAVIAQAKIVVVRCLGGLDYWRYGIERAHAAAAANGVRLAVLPGDDRPDPRLAALSTVPEALCAEFDAYFRAGGHDNLTNLLRRLFAEIGHPARAEPPGALPRGFAWCPGCGVLPLAAAQAAAGPGPRALLLVYRSAVLAGDTAPAAALAAALSARGIGTLALAVSSLKDPEAIATVQTAIRAQKPDIVIAATAFSAREDAGFVLDAADCPVLQAYTVGAPRAAWAASARGLNAADLAMQVALPEFDGRLAGFPIAFKEEGPEVEGFSERRAVPDAEGIAALADRAAAWVHLARLPRAERRIAMVLSDYPARGGRAGYAVGLDTPESARAIAADLREAGYACGALPEAGMLMRALTEGEVGLAVPLADYTTWFAGLPQASRAALTERWGRPEEDPLCTDGAFRFRMAEADAPPPPSAGEGACGAGGRGAGAALPGKRSAPLSRPASRATLPRRGGREGRLTLFLQPDRGRAADRKAGYHDPDEPPTHAYLAFHLGLRTRFDALIHLGTHGTTEWLPGKAVALSPECWPARAIGPLPVVYPFIVDDPGEAAPLKRRLGGIALGHLTPTVEAAGLTPEAAALRELVEEYSAASVLDPRRAALVAEAILDEAGSLGLMRGAGIDADTPMADALTALDAHLCDLGETPFRDGLHVFGRGAATTHQTGRSLSSRQPANPFSDPTRSPPPCGEEVGGGGGAACRDRSQAAPPPPFIPPRKGEGNAHASRASMPPDDRIATSDACANVTTDGPEALEASALSERSNLVAALDGRFVPPGPSGSPSRGRIDVLPTGRNLATLDPRSLPTRAASLLGAKAAEAVLRRYLQDEGEYPARIVMDLWASPTLRTGGEDVAHALALMGVRPVWDHASTRVTGFELLPLALLDRPRIDVTVRVSGAFRDTFPDTLALLDSAARAVAAREEEDDENPLAAARRRGESGARVYGAAPGRYGAGAAEQALDGAWDDRGDLGRAYLDATTHAYGSTDAADADFAARVAAADAYVHAFDVAERDLLDGEAGADAMGGFAAAAAQAGRAPALYSLDVANPEAPRARTAAEDVARLIRGRLSHPRWIAAQLRHGWRGAQEFAQGLDAVFVLAATTDAVSDADLDRLHAAWIGDLETFDAIVSANPRVAHALLDRFNDLKARGLWTTRRNTAPAEALMPTAAE